MLLLSLIHIICTFLRHERPKSMSTQTSAVPARGLYIEVYAYKNQEVTNKFKFYIVLSL